MAQAPMYLANVQHVSVAEQSHRNVNLFILTPVPPGRDLKDSSEQVRGQGSRQPRGVPAACPEGVPAACPGVGGCQQPEPHQPLSADDQQPAGAVDLGQSDFLVEGAVASHHHGDLVVEAPIRDVGGGAQNRGCLILQLQERLQQSRKDSQLHLRHRPTAEIPKRGWDLHALQGPRAAGAS